MRRGPCFHPTGQGALGRAVRRSALAIVLLSGAACQPEAASHEPARPDGVPEEAIWVGGADGGVFLLVVGDGDPAYRGCIFFDRSPHLSYNGLLVKNTPGPIEGALDDPAAFDAWDGVRLHLAEGGWLRAASPFNPETFGHDDSAEACDLDYAPTAPPLPAGVPEDSVWLGGPFDGAFVHLSPAAGTDAPYEGTVYYDYSGEVAYAGAFRLEPPEPGPVDVTDRSQLTDWDGVAIHLADGRRLVPVQSD